MKLDDVFIIIKQSTCHFHSPTPSGDDVILAKAAAAVKSSCVKILSCVIWLQHVNSYIETRIDESMYANRPH